VLGGGHHAIQETAIGKTRYDAAKKPVMLDGIQRCPAPFTAGMPKLSAARRDRKLTMPILKVPAPARRCKPELPNLHTPMSPPGR
jgi:hypothetical protein